MWALQKPSQFHGCQYPHSLSHQVISTHDIEFKFQPVKSYRQVSNIRRTLVGNYIVDQ